MDVNKYLTEGIESGNVSKSIDDFLEDLTEAAKAKKTATTKDDIDKAWKRADASKLKNIISANIKKAGQTTDDRKLNKMHDITARAEKELNTLKGTKSQQEFKNTYGAKWTASNVLNKDRLIHKVSQHPGKVALGVGAALLYGAHVINKKNKEADERRRRVRHLDQYASPHPVYRTQDDYMPHQQFSHGGPYGYLQ